MQLLPLVQEFLGRTGLPIASAVASSSDPRVVQIRGLLNEFLEDMLTRQAWQINILETVFTSVAGEDQGLLSTLCPHSFQNIVWKTLFNRTLRLPMFGAVSPQDWQARKAFNISGPLYSFRVRGGKLLATPPLPAGHTISFEYNSGAFVRAADGTPKAYWTVDTDTCALDDALPLSYLRWAWKKEKGLDYAEEFAKYERLVATKLARDKTADAVDMAGGNKDLRPGIWIPAGNWNVN